MAPGMAWSWHHWLLLVALLVTSARMAFASPGNNYQVLTDHQVWEAEGHAAMRVVAGLEREGLADILGHSAATPRFRVAPDSRALVSAALTQAGINYKVLIHDLGSHIRDEQDKATRDVTKGNRKESCTEESCPKPLTDSYMTFEQMEWYLKELTDKSSRVDLESIGKSTEGRNIWRVHIKPTSNKESGKKNARNSVWLEGGLHAREWISPAVTLYLIHKMVADTSITQNLDVYVVPMANPDGYVYSGTSDRYWRKNRRPNEKQPRCSGVDLNRNWDMQYGVGASDNPCSEVYKGTEAFSEPETQALRDEMLLVSSGGNLVLMLSLHSYGQVLLYPWGYTDEVAPNTPKMKRAGKRFAQGASILYGTKYAVLNSASGFYYASGTTDDWAKGVLKTPFSYTLELRDEGNYGFNLPPKMIDPTSREVWKGVKKMLIFVNKVKI